MINKIIKTVILTIIICMCFTYTNVYATTATALGETVRIREEASTSSETVVLISQGEEVEILSEQGEWYEVSYTNADGISYEGYIRSDLLEVEETTETETTDTEEETTQDSETEETDSADTEESSSTDLEETEEEEESSEEVVSEENDEEIAQGDQLVLENSVEIKILPLITSHTINKAKSQITITEIVGNWCYIESENDVGWVNISKLNQAGYEKSENASETESEEEEGNTETVTSRGSDETRKTKTDDVEETESEADDVDETDEAEEANEVEEAEDEEAETEKTDSKKSSSSTVEADESREEEEVQITGADVVSYAKKFLGCDYVYGGVTPDGFDCSGFTQYVYAHFGYTLSRSSVGQQSDGTKVKQSDLEEGDLVCFTRHVGIYVGDGNFIHAESYSEGVTISSLSESYYSSRYVTARRIIN